jgi:hypothetical protein
MHKPLLKVLLLMFTINSVKGIINPMTLYTPITAVTQAAQTSAVLQQALTPSAPNLNTSPVASTNPHSLPTDVIIPLSPETLTTGQTIQTAGYYQLTASSHCAGNQTPLTIAASNIIFDLNGQTLQYQGSSTNLHGIVITPGTTNVTIQNGTIAGFPGGGIAAAGTQDQPINNLTLQNLKIISCYHGILTEEINTLVISNCNTSNNKNPKQTTCGIEASNSTGITIQHCVSQNNTSPVGNCYGYIITQCKNTTLINCTATGNEGLLESAGISFESMVTNNLIQNCACNGNRSLSMNAYGILLSNSKKTCLQDSWAQFNESEDATHFSYGIHLRNSSRTFIKHNVTDGNDYGIYDDESFGEHTNIFTQNIAYQNTYSDYLRPNSSPLACITIKQELLQGILAAGTLDNISIRITS